MSEKEVLKGLEKISQAVGDSPDMVQGGGGNTSAKIDDQVLAIKASGFKLTQITEDDGFVKVNYRNLLDYYDNVDTSENKDFEEESTEVVMNNVVSEEKLKPSIETGFHSLLKKYVIHTHSVYANIICCSENGEELMEDIFSDENYKPLWVRYTHPGFDLTLEMKKRVDQYVYQEGGIPEVIFLENHGLIVNKDDAEDCIDFNTEVNNKIKTFFNITENYPETGIEKLDDGRYKTKTEYLIDFFKDSNISLDYFDNILYPDQLVYLEDSISIDENESKTSINTDTGEVNFNADYNEALTIDETLTAYVYIMNKIKENNIKLQTMTQKYIDLIKNMQGEKHRKKVMKEMK